MICGTTSTKITPPTLSRIAQYQFIINEPAVGDPTPAYRSNWVTGNAINIPGKFVSDNINCPINAITIEKGDTNFDITDKKPDFELDFKTSFLEVVGIYQYTIKAVADGDKTITINNEVEIKRVCRSGIKPTFAGLKDKFEYFVPNTGQVDVTFPASYAEYVEEPLEKCVHTFTIQMANGEIKPSELTLDKVTGKVGLETTPKNKREYLFDIIIDTSGSDVAEQ